MRERGAQQPVAVGPEHHRHAPGRLREQHRVLDVREAPLERHAFAREQTTDDLERLLEPRSALPERDAERAELRLVPAGADPEDEPSAAHLVDRRRHPGEDPGRVERRAGDQRAEPDAFGGRREGRERRPRVPRPAFGASVASVQQVVAEPDRVEAGGLGRAGHRDDLGPPHVAFDLGELDADAELPGHRRSVRCVRPGEGGGSMLAAEGFELVFRRLHMATARYWRGLRPSPPASPARPSSAGSVLSGPARPRARRVLRRRARPASGRPARPR